MKHESVVAIVVALGLSGCAGAPPQDALTAAEKSISAAEVGGAEETPKAKLHLKLARDQVAEAKELIEEDEIERAELVIERAQADAEVALAAARHEKARQEADDIIADVKKLKDRIGASK
jgi:hypothetical protein